MRKIYQRRTDPCLYHPHPTCSRIEYHSCLFSSKSSYQNLHRQQLYYFYNCTFTAPIHFISPNVVTFKDCLYVKPCITLTLTCALTYSYFNNGRQLDIIKEIRFDPTWKSAEHLSYMLHYQGRDWPRLMFHTEKHFTGGKQIKIHKEYFNLCMQFSNPLKGYQLDKITTSEDYVYILLRSL